MKKLHNIRQLKYLALFIILAHNLVAQTTLQVVTKHIEKTFSGSQILIIEAEKADIEVVTWDKQEIKIEIDLIAKHPDRKVASSDLETLKYIADKINKEIFVRNYLLIQNEKLKPTSNLKAKYTVRVPEGMKITIQNSFGKVLVKGKVKLLKIKSDFCIIELNDVDGKIELNTHYGEINAKNNNGVSMITSERSDLIINKLSGDCTINSQYGKLTIEAMSNLKTLTIDAKKSDIVLGEISLKNHSFNLTSKYGKMSLPAEFSWLENDKTSKVAIFNSTHPSKINITNSFGNITINN
jgi:Putative adhesin